MIGFDSGPIMQNNSLSSAQLFSVDLFSMALDYFGVVSSWRHSWHTAAAVLQTWQFLMTQRHMVLLKRESRNLHPAALTPFSSHHLSLFCPHLPASFHSRPLSCISCKQAEGEAPIGWTLPPRGWPDNDLGAPGTRPSWCNTPSPPPCHTATTQYNNVLKIAPSPLLTLT